jgi:hypothetical protein
MSTKLKYSLKNLWDFSDKQIIQILKYFKTKQVDPLSDRLEAILLSFDNDLLIEEEMKYVESDQFDKLFLSTNEQLRNLSDQLGYDGNNDHIDMIKFIIDNDIKIVSSIPLQFKDKIEIYQMNKDLYVCGSGTFTIKDDLKLINGRWDSKNKCWILPQIVKSDLLKLIPKKVATPIKKSEIKNQPLKQIHPNILIVDKVPIKIDHDLQLYQINNNVLLCGKKTYDIKDDLKLIGSKFNGSYKCWSIPHDQINYVLNLVEENKEKDILEKERIQEQKTTTRLKNIEEKNLIKKENLILQKRLEKEEPELSYIRHIDRLSKDEFAILKKKYSYDEIYDMMEDLDVKELKEIWDSKIIYVDYGKDKHKGYKYKGNYKYVTYIGDYRPSDQVLEYWANHWYPLVAGQPGYAVKRVDYKIYDIYAFSTD